MPSNEIHPDHPDQPTTASGRDDLQRTWVDLHAHAVTVLSTVCRLRIASPGTDGWPARPVPVDFGEFLAAVLASVAANLGSTDRLTLGRPGSWEADLVHELVVGTVGDDETWLWGHRTEPVVVPLNVPALAWELPGFPDCDDALQQLYAVDAIDTVTGAGGPDGQGLTDEQWDALDAATRAAETAVLDAYTRLYQQYAAAFTAAVHRAAAAQYPALAAAGIPVTVTAVTDPATPPEQAARVTNPVDDLAAGPCDDLLAVRLWEAAAAAVPIPAAPVLAVLAVPPT